MQSQKVFSSTFTKNTQTRYVKRFNIAQEICSMGSIINKNKSTPLYCSKLGVVEAAWLMNLNQKSLQNLKKIAEYFKKSPIYLNFPSIRMKNDPTNLLVNSFDRGNKFPIPVLVSEKSDPKEINEFMQKLTPQKILNLLQNNN